jgi:predicted secreted Zn-dependent protease
MRIRQRGWLVLAGLIPATGLLAQPARAQTFEVGRLPRDVTIDVIQRPYTIRGRTAEELLLQMVQLGPGGFVSFPYFYEWRFSAEEATTAFAGNRSGMCRVRDFAVAFDITATYPVWEQPPDVPPQLVAAWDEFGSQLQQRWVARRDGMVEFGREISRAARRVEEACPFMQARVQEVVERFREDGNEAARVAAAAGETVLLRWPPEGYREPLAGGGPSSPGRSP